MEVKDRLPGRRQGTWGNGSVLNLHSSMHVVASLPLGLGEWNQAISSVVSMMRDDDGRMGQEGNDAQQVCGY